MSLIHDALRDNGPAPPSRRAPAQGRVPADREPADRREVPPAPPAAPPEARTPPVLPVADTPARPQRDRDRHRVAQADAVLATLGYRRTGRRRLTLALLAIVLVILIGAGTWVWWRATLS